MRWENGSLNAGAVVVPHSLSVNSQMTKNEFNMHLKKLAPIIMKVNEFEEEITRARMNSSAPISNFESQPGISPYQANHIKNVTELQLQGIL